MNATTFDYMEMRALVNSEQEYEVSVIGANGEWRVFIHALLDARALSSVSGGLPVVFATLSEVELELRELGVLHFEVTASRSDSCEDAPATEADPAYDAWFRAQVQEALDDTSPPIPHEEAMRQLRAALKLS